MVNATIENVRDYMQSDSNEFTDSQILFFLGMASKKIPSIVSTTDSELLAYLEAMYCAVLLIFTKPQLRGYTSTGTTSSLGNKIRIGRISIDNTSNVSNKIKDTIELANFYYNQFLTYSDGLSLNSDIQSEMGVTTPSEYLEYSYGDDVVDGRHFSTANDTVDIRTKKVYNSDKRYI